jgi:hypothetical protein
MSDHAQHQWDQTTFNGPTEHEWTPDELATEYGPEIKTHGIGSAYAVNHLDDSLMLMAKRAYQLADDFPESRHYDVMDYAGELYAFGSLCLDMAMEISK